MLLTVGCWLAGERASISDPLVLQAILEDYRAAVVTLQSDVKAAQVRALEAERLLAYLCCEMTDQVQRCLSVLVRS